MAYYDDEEETLEYNKGNASTFVSPRDFFSLSVSADLINISRKEFFNFVFLTHVTLNEGIKTIGKWAFCHCHELREITIPSTVNKVGEGAFAKCVDLRKAVFSNPSSAVVYLELGPQIFSGCKSLRTLHLRVGIKKIPKQFCRGCSSLETIDYCGAAIETIEESAFQECSKLKGIICLPKTTRTIGIKAFFKCRRLKSNIFSEAETTASGGLELIGDSAFAHCSGLENVLVPSSVRSIGNQSFDSCENLLSVELSASTPVHPCAFSNCPKLRNIKLARLQPTAGEDMLVATAGINGCTWMMKKLHNSRPTELDTDNIGNWLLQKVCHRWDDLPIHRLCYYQAHHPVQVTVEAMQQEANGGAGAGSNNKFQLYDEFGMSPFRILILSTKPRYDILAQLMRLYSIPAMMMLPRRVHEPPPPRYVTTTSLQQQGGLGVGIDNRTVIQAFLRAIVSSRVPQLRLKSWRMTILQLVEGYDLEQQQGEDCYYLERRRRGRAGGGGDLAGILEKLKHFELMESLALLEQTVWKAKLLVEGDLSTDRPKKRIKMDGANDHHDHDRRPNSEKVDRRQACRTVSGADIVIARVLPYLDESNLPNAPEMTRRWAYPLRQLLVD